MEGLTRVTRVRVSTPFGPPSDAIVVGDLEGVRIAFLARHGRGHRLSPSEINYRANIYALKKLGVERVVSVSAVGSMKEAFHPGHVVIPHQFFDQTRRRIGTFFERGVVAHVALADPVCRDEAGKLAEAARKCGATVHEGGVYLCIEGPQFSTRGESLIYRQWGVDVIGMTNLPEAKLAREAQLCYATLALVTDYDCWHPGHDAVTVDATVETPFGEQHDALGGSAAFFATAASYFPPVSLIAVVGKDFPEVHLKFLQMRGIDLTGLERRPGKTFRWRGEYSHQLNEARTLETQLNVFETFRPRVPEAYQSPDLLFLANIDPELQHTVLQQVKRPALVACDTMNFWIEGKRSALFRLLKDVDVLIINDGEARALGGDPNLVKVARTIRTAGPSTLIVKRGEYGVLRFSRDRIFAAPAFPLEQVKDPTGAGDCFAGGVMGYLASTGNLSEEAFCRAVVFGSVMASFAVEEFSLDRLRQLDYKEIEDRFKAFKQLTFFEAV